MSPTEPTRSSLVLAAPETGVFLHPVLLTEDEGSDPRNRKHEAEQPVPSAGNPLRGPREKWLSEPGAPCSGVSAQAEALMERLMFRRWERWADLLCQSVELGNRKTVPVTAVCRGHCVHI